MWEFLSSKVLLVIQAWQINTSGFELGSWLLHFVESTIVIIDISVSASTVWLVNNASVIMVALSVVVLRGTNGRAKSLMGYVSEIFGIGEHFLIEND